MRAFISHISEEASVASRLKEALNQDFPGRLDVFVSSDGESIAAGENWLKSIRKALHDSSLLVILCSPASIHRPWINFEAGAAWLLKKPIIPLCHAGLRPRDLPMPLSLRQGLELSNARDLRQLYKKIAGFLSCEIPSRSFDGLANELAELSKSISVRPAELHQIEEDRGIAKRLSEALSHTNFKWRTLQWVAAEAGVMEEVAADLLRANEEVRFSRSRKSGKIIVGLRSRVGEGGGRTSAEQDR